MRKEDKSTSLTWQILQLLVLLSSGVWWTIGELLTHFLPKKSKSVAGKVVLVTGSSRGLGREIALLLANRGAILVLTSSKQSGVEAVKEEIESRGGRAFAYQCDVSDEEQVHQLSRKVEQEVGHVDILVNNAAVLDQAPLVELTSRQIRRTYDVNLMAHHWTIKEFLPEMLQRKEGHIVAICSIASFIPKVNLSSYCGTKHAMTSLMSCVEQEVEATEPEAEIRFTTVCPGPFHSGLINNVQNRMNFFFPCVGVKYVARETVRAILTEQNYLVIPSVSRFIFAIGQTIFSRKAMIKCQRIIGYSFEAIS